MRSSTAVWGHLWVTRQNVGSVLQWEWTSECILQKVVRLLIHSFCKGGLVAVREGGFLFFPVDWKPVECALFLSSHRSLPVG